MRTCYALFGLFDCFVLLSFTMPSSHGNGSGRSGTNWKQTRHDRFYLLAKEQGYRSRAAFKLIQINKKYALLQKARVLVDLCAAPGGWMQVAQRTMPAQSMIIGVDILPIRPIPGATALQQDITTPQCRAALKQELQGWNVDVVTHDGAPNVSGGTAFAMDAYKQNELVLHALTLATKLLRSGGSFISKVFRSQDYNALLWALKKLFQNVEVNKPVASRAASAEIFVICTGYLAPKKIDPKLLDPAYVFQQFETPKTGSDVLHRKKEIRSRMGYDNPEGKQIIFNQVPIEQFVNSESEDKAVEMLGSFNAFTWSGSELCKLFEAHECTTEEIKLLVADLKLLNKSDFKSLLRWRKRMRNHQGKLARESALHVPVTKSVEVPQPTEIESVAAEEQMLEKELDVLKHKQEMEKKHERKKRREAKNKLKKRLAMNANNLNMDVAEEELFSLKDVEDDEHINLLEKAGYATESSYDDVASDLSVENADSVSSQSEDDLYIKKLESTLDSMYDAYKIRKKIAEKKREQLGIGHEPSLPDEDTSGNDVDENEDYSGLHSPNDSDIEANAVTPSNPLLFHAQDTSTNDERATRWFERDIFAAAQSIQNEGIDSDSRRSRKRKQLDDVSSSDSDVISADDTEGQFKHSPNIKSHYSANVEANAPVAAKRQPKKIVNDSGADGFEVVENTHYSSDDDAIAERLAIGQLLLNKRSREDLIDGGYNRYMFDDKSELPDWFLADENRHNKAALPVTGHQVAAQKARLMAINARPIKKIAEAQARKKVRALRRWEKVKQQAESITANQDLNTGQKIKQIEQMMIRQHKQKNKKPDRQYVVSKKGGGGSTVSKARKGAKIVKVDRRMKKETRSAKRRAQKTGAKHSHKKRKTH